jgi:pimeloyl-ACP methyl ester carboxylesterase
LALRSFADGALFGETFGEGPPRVLALHGWGRRGADFNTCLEGLPAIALDLPGFGASPPPSEVLGAEGYADIVASVLPSFDGPPVLVGHSFGGRVAVCLAADRPAEVGDLVLTGVPLLRRSPAKQPPIAYRVIRMLNEIGLISDERLEAAKHRRGSADYRAATGIMRDILVKVVNEEYPAQLARLGSHVHMVWGSDDAEVPVAVAERALTMVDRGELEMIDGVGHHVPLQAPDRLRAIVESLLA